MSAHYVLCGMLIVSVIRGMLVVSVMLAWKTPGEPMTFGYQTMGGAHDILVKDHWGSP